ncbi:MAG TPA: methylated-DNA--[protein]-cysteine S-methyltransferase [Acidothermaceae bacterium]|nr:methylated-DNA--[protein]-cysteine S-methyltransferase [Acidothermaceae bacterium]
MSVQTYFTVLPSPIGELLVTGADDAPAQFAITGLFMTGQRYEPMLRPEWVRDANRFADAEKQLEAYFGGDLTDFDLPLAARGSEFQRSVWAALCDIPLGATKAYGQIAQQVADKTKTRAVAAAIGRNPIGIVVPCHRVIGADGSLTGYAGGLDRKRWLLDHEARVSGASLL